MCGICGQFNFRNDKPADVALVSGMTARLAHRGPDDEGLYSCGPIAMGFRRLSIIDIAGGRQPMSDVEESVWVVFNGEIYNFPELKAELIHHGHVFRTNSDTEVIVHGYKQWGQDVFGHLNGMFGVAIWDTKQRQLTLARDRMGIKLVYYRIDKNAVYFSSELRPLLNTHDSAPAIDPAAVNLFLRYRYTPSPLTIIDGVRKLAPGTRLVAKHGQAPTIDRWWNYVPEPFDPMPSAKRAEETLIALYDSAVKRQLMSDVPVGLLLSGGLDSGLLLALMKRHRTEGPTYTVGYGSSFTNDELETAARTARILNTPNYSVTLNTQEFDDSLQSVIRALEEPIASSSVVPMYHVCRRAREDVKVALMGQGPDELFGGYTRHLGVRYGGYWRALPAWLRGYASTRLGGRERREWVKRGIYALGTRDRMLRYQKVLSIVTDNEGDELFRPEILAAPLDPTLLSLWKDFEAPLRATDELGGLQFLEIRSTLPDELLMYADKLSMAHGLEVRVPYLDHEIVEYVERLNCSFKVRHGRRKWLHRRVCRRFLPPEVVNRRKAGFAVNVVDEWFRRSLSSKMDHILQDTSSMIYQLMRPSAVGKLLHDHKEGKQNNHKILFSLVVLEYSLRNYAL